MSGRTLAAPLAALALAAGGCETGDQAGPAEEAQAATETFLASCARGHVEAAELSLTEPARRLFITAGEHLTGCLAVTELELPGELSPEEVQALFHEADTTEVHVDGGFAEVGIEARGARRTLELETVRGLWLISGATSAAAL